MISIEHVVHKDHSFAGDVNCHVSTFAGDHVEIAFYFLDIERARLFSVLRIGDPGRIHRQKEPKNRQEDCSFHVETCLPVLDLKSNGTAVTAARVIF